VSKLRLFKDSGRYYLLGEGLYLDITEQVLEEIQIQKDLDRHLLEYSRDNSTQDSELAIVRIRQKATRAQLVALMGRAQAAYDSWAKGQEHGDMLKLKRHIQALRSWLQKLGDDG